MKTLNPIQYNKLDAKSNGAKRLLETFGLVEANSAERYYLFFNLKQNGYTVEEISEGYSINIGTFHGHSICLNFFWHKVNGVLVGYYSPDGVIVNWDMVKEWIKKNLPHVKANNDAMNFHNTLNGLGIEQTPISVKTALLHVTNEFEYQREQLLKLYSKFPISEQIIKQ